MINKYSNDIISNLNNISNIVKKNIFSTYSINEMYNKLENLKRLILFATSSEMNNWSRDKDIEKFKNLIEQIKSIEHYHDFTVYVPLCLSILSNSYILKDIMPERAIFRNWCIEKFNKTLGKERTEAIFGMLN